MPEPGKTTTPIGRASSNVVIALERCRLLMPGPVRLEHHLGDLARMAQQAVIFSALLRTGARDLSRWVSVV
jgi:hypothetical protein